MTADTSKAASPAVTRTTSTRSISTVEGLYPDGHLGRLSQKQQDTLAAFKKYTTDKGVYKPGPPPSHDDGLLLRFLRARRWVVEDAFKQLKETEDWRAANDINTLYDTIDLDAYEQSRRLYPQWTGRRDRRGIPLYVFVIKPLDNKTINAYEKQGKGKAFSEAKVDGKTAPGLLRLFALYENLTRFNMPFCTQLPDREFNDVPITMSTNIVDISGVGLKQFWDLKNHMQAASQLATAHYPETLDRIFIIGAPAFFSTVWSWIKRWFDPITVSKIFILSQAEVKPTLEAFIEPQNIPKKYGGELDFEWGSLATVDPAWEGVVEWENGYTGFPSGPLLWEDVEDGQRMQCISAGAKDGQRRTVVVCKMNKYWPIKSATGSSSEANGSEVAAGNEVATSSEGTVRGDNDQAEEAVTSGDTLEKLKIEEDKEAPAPTTTATAA